MFIGQSQSLDLRQMIPSIRIIYKFFWSTTMVATFTYDIISCIYHKNQFRCPPIELPKKIIILGAGSLNNGLLCCSYAGIDFNDIHSLCESRHHYASEDQCNSYGENYGPCVPNLALTSVTAVADGIYFEITWIFLWKFRSSITSFFGCILCLAISCHGPGLETIRKWDNIWNAWK